jgi:hypothetical protein
MLAVVSPTYAQIKDVGPPFTSRPLPPVQMEPSETCLLVCDKHCDICLNNANGDAEELTVCETAKQTCYNQCPLEPIKP